MDMSDCIHQKYRNCKHLNGRNPESNAIVLQQNGNQTGPFRAQCNAKKQFKPETPTCSSSDPCAHRMKEEICAPVANYSKHKYNREIWTASSNKRCEQHRQEVRDEERH